MTTTAPPLPTPATAAQITVRNPVTGADIGTLPVCDAGAVAQTAARARTAQPAWGAQSVRERGRVLSRWMDELWNDQRAVMATIRRETGKTDGGAFSEVALLSAVTGYYNQYAPRFLAAHRRPATFPILHTVQVSYQPRGVCGFITPWNYPLALALIDLIPALFAGNGVVIKPSEVTPFSVIDALTRLQNHLKAASLDPALVGIVTGDASTGAALIDVVDYLSFTGSTATGRKVAARAAARLIPYSLELGGKDPAIVLDDADLDLAAAGVLTGALENSGQVCVSIERVYVLDGVYDTFVARLRDHASRLVQGNGDGMTVHLGSLTHERELLRTEAQVSDAVAKGASVLFGGERVPALGPYFYAPTALVDVTHEMAIMHEETFGPLIPIMRVRDEAEAVHLANDSIYGLSATVFTGDLARGRRLAADIVAGDVAINRAQLNFFNPAAPMGGEKDSGLGRRGGPEGLLRFARTHTVITERPWRGLLGVQLSHTSPLIVWAFGIMRRLRPWLPL